MNNLNGVNTRNYSQKTNFMCGTNSVKLLPFYVTTISLPGVSTTIPEVSGRSGAPVFLAPSNMTFNPLSLEVLLDENYQIFQDLIDAIKIDVESGTFESTFFDFWVEVTNDMGQTVMKIDYFNCNIESIGDLSLASNDDTTEQTFPVELKYDYFKIRKSVSPVLKV
jgi:hypothetical protein